MSDILEAPPDPPDKVPTAPPGRRGAAATPAAIAPRATLAPTRKALWTFAGVGGLASVVGLLAGPSAQVAIGPLLPLVVAGTLVSTVLALRSHPSSAAAPHATGASGVTGVASAADAADATASRSQGATDGPTPQGDAPEDPPVRLG